VLPYLVVANVKSLYDSSPLKHLVNKYYNRNRTLISGKKLIVGAVNWKYGKYEIATELNPDIHKWILASSAFPLFLDNIKINDLWYTDGGIRDTLPLADAINAGATEVDVVLASPLQVAKDDNLPCLTDQLMRVLSVMCNEVLKNDLIDIARLHPEVKIRVFLPEKPLIKNALNFNRKELRYMFNEGQKAALNPISPQEIYGVISRC
jgi:predicted patatin/cPLA2 family phospholipase